MEIDVYIDVLWVVNFMLDYLLLWLTAVFTKAYYRQWRVCAGAAAGATYAVGIFFAPLAFLYGLAGKLLLSALMVWIALGFRTPKRYLRVLCVFYACSFSLSGACIALFTFTNLAARVGGIWSNGVFYINLPLFVLLLSAVLVYAILRTAFFFMQKRQLRGSLIKTLFVIHNGRIAKLRALLDTGNTVREPSSGCGVVLAEWDKIKHLFEDEITGTPFTAIPYSTIGGGGTLLGFRPDELYLSERGQHPLPELYIGIVNKKIDRAGEYHAVLPDIPLQDEWPVCRPHPAKRNKKPGGQLPTGTSCS